MKKFLLLFLVATGIVHPIEVAPGITIKFETGQDGSKKILTTNTNDNIKGLDTIQSYSKQNANSILAGTVSGICYLVGAIQFLRGTYKMFCSETGTYTKALADFDEDAIKEMNPKQLERLLDQEDENRLAQLENFKTYLNSAIWLGLGGIFYLYANSGTNKALLDPATPRVTPTTVTPSVTAK